MDSCPDPKNNKPVLLVAREAEAFFAYRIAVNLIKDGTSAENIFVFFVDISDFIYVKNDNLKWLKGKNIIPDENILSIKDDYIKLNQNKDSLESFFSDPELIKKDQTYSTKRTLWELVYTDLKLVSNFHYRHWFNKSSHGEICALIKMYIDMFEEIIDTHNIELVIDSNNIYLGRNILFEMCRDRNIPHYVPMITRVGKCIMFFKNFTMGTDESITQLLDDPDFDARKGKDYIENFKTRLTSYEAHKKNQKIFKSRQNIINGTWFVFYNIIRTFYIRTFKKHHYAGFFKSALFTTVGHKVVKYWVEYLFRNQYMSINKKKIFNHDLDYQKLDYAFYPLHAVPENSTVLNASLIPNELAMIEYIAKTLPVHFKLIVKEHLIMIGERPIHFYKKLMEIPNVELAPYDISGTSLVKEAKITITLSGTSALESVMIGKPAIIFGNVDYEECEGIFKAGDLFLLPELIKKALKHKVDEDKVAKFIAAVMARSTEGDYSKCIHNHLPDKITEDRVEEIDNLYRLLVKTIDQPYGVLN